MRHLSFCLTSLLILFFACASPESNQEEKDGPVAGSLVEDRKNNSNATSDRNEEYATDREIGNLDLLMERAQPTGQAEGILFAFYKDQAYESHYYLLETGKVTEHLILPYLVTPQKDGFLYIQEMNTLDSLDRESENDPDYPFVYSYERRGPRVFNSPEALQAALQNQKDHPVKHPDIDDREGDLPFYSEQGTREIKYILPGLVSLEDYGDGYGGGAHDYYWRNQYTVPFSRLGAENRNLYKLQDSLFHSQHTEEEWAEIKRQIYIRGPKSDDDLDEVIDLIETWELDSSRLGDQIGDYPDDVAVDTEELDFRLDWWDGSLQLICMGYASAPYIVSHVYSIRVEYASGPLGPPYLHQTEWPVPPDSIRKMEVNLLMLSPGQNYVLYSIFSTMRGYDLNSGKLIEGEAINVYDGFIMAEWAVGDHAHRWLEELRP